MDKRRFMDAIKDKVVRETTPTIKDEPKADRIITESDRYGNLVARVERNCISLGEFPAEASVLLAAGSKVNSLKGLPDQMNFIDVSGCRNLRSLDGLPEHFLYFHLYGTGGVDCGVREERLIIDAKKHWHKFRYANADAWIINLTRKLQGLEPYPKNSLAELAGNYADKPEDGFYSRYSRYHENNNRSNSIFTVNGLPITSLYGAPKLVSNFYASRTKITDLTGAPDKVSSRASFSNTSSLTSLKGCPKVGCGVDSIVEPEWLNDSKRGVWSYHHLAHRGMLFVDGTALESFDGIRPEFCGGLMASDTSLRSINDLPERLLDLDITGRKVKIEPLNHRLQIDSVLSCDADSLEKMIDRLELGPKALVMVSSRKGGPADVNVSAQVREYTKER